MKIFVDTNVLVSAFVARGLCSDLIEVILADHFLLTGEFVLDELQRVLTTKLNVPQSHVSETIQFLRKCHVEQIPNQPSNFKFRNAADLWLLESAIRAKADVLITGDNDFLNLTKNISVIKIISPRGFWNILKT